MAVIRTFVDADVLIWAARGRSELSQAALQVLTSPGREFVASEFLELEVLPKAVYNRQVAEEAFYRRFFAAVAAQMPITQRLIALARAHAMHYGLSAVDAFHVASAQGMNAVELVTAERESSPLFRVQEVRIVSIRPAASGMATS